MMTRLEIRAVEEIVGRVQTNLATIRKRRGVGASELAKKVGVTRQTIYAIEAGTYVPNTEVTLNCPLPRSQRRRTVLSPGGTPGRTRRDSHCGVSGTNRTREMDKRCGSAGLAPNGSAFPSMPAPIIFPKRML